MKLFKSATLLVCISLAACSSVDEKPATGPVEPVASAAAPVTIDAKWLDGYESRLREAVKGSRFDVERRGDLLLVVAPVQGTFNPDRPGMLLPASLAPITRIAKLVEKDEQAAVMIFGHADASGDADANRTLSGERAGAFGAIFRLSGLKQDRLLIQGMGADLPRASNDTRQGRAKNRRVEVLLGPQNGLDQLLAQYQGASEKTADATATAQFARAERKPQAGK